MWTRLKILLTGTFNGIAVDNELRLQRLPLRRSCTPREAIRRSAWLRVTVKPDSTLAGPETVLVGKLASNPCPPPANTVDCITANSPHDLGTVRSDPRDGTLWVGTGDGSNSGGMTPPQCPERAEPPREDPARRSQRQRPAGTPLLPVRQRPDPRVHQDRSPWVPQPVPLHPAPRRQPGRGRRGLVVPRGDEPDHTGQELRLALLRGHPPPALLLATDSPCTALYAQEGTSGAAIPADPRVPPYGQGRVDHRRAHLPTAGTSQRIRQQRSSSPTT